MESYFAEQKSHFSMMRQLLTELTNAVPQEFLRKTLSDDAATIEVGWNRPEDGTFETTIRWNIEPSHHLNDDSDDEPPSLESTPGFDLQETSFLCYEMYESKRSFPDASQLLEYIAKEMAKQVATFQHIRGKGKR